MKYTNRTYMCVSVCCFLFSVICLCEEQQQRYLEWGRGVWGLPVWWSCWPAATAWVRQRTPKCSLMYKGVKHFTHSLPEFAPFLIHTSWAYLSLKTKNPNFPCNGLTYNFLIMKLYLIITQYFPRLPLCYKSILEQGRTRLHVEKYLSQLHHIFHSLLHASFCSMLFPIDSM